MRVLRAWAGGQRDNLPVEMPEAALSMEQDGEPDALLECLVCVAGSLVVHPEDAVIVRLTCPRLEVFQRALVVDPTG